MKNLKMKQRRLELGLKQADLAKTVGVARQTISLIESGDFNPSIKLCVAICRALQVTLNDLFWEPEPESESDGQQNAEYCEEEKEDETVQ